MAENESGAARRPRLLLVVNPRTSRGTRAELWSRAVIAFERGGDVVARLETRGDGSDVERLAAAALETKPEVVVAAGGDGTIDDAVAAILSTDATARPALALMPLGTANNIARSLGLRSVRSEGEAALALATSAALGKARHAIDVGFVDGRPFAGAVAFGMDADILDGRNRLRRMLRLSGNRAGYALYLTSCFLCLLSPRHGGAVHLRLDAVEERTRAFNLVVANAPVYAGEFRFDGANDCDDGRLDVRLDPGTIRYVRTCYDSWRRHLRFVGGETVEASPLLRRAAEIHAVFEKPVAAQVDGEPLPPAKEFHIAVARRAIEIAMP